MEWRLSSTLAQLSTLLKYVMPTSPPVRTAVKLSYKIIADCDTDPQNPPIFLLHGLLGHKKHFEGFGRTLLSITKRSVVVADLRNHGDSPHVNSHRYDELAEDVLQLLNKLEIKRACMVGHSMGGRTCMCLALMAPEKVLGQLVVDISPVSSPPELTQYLPKVLAAMQALDFKRQKSVRKARKAAVKQLKSLITDDLIMRTVLSNIRVKREQVRWICNLDTLVKEFHHIASFPESLKGKVYDGPTLFIGGQLSDFIPPDDLTKIREYFPAAVVHYVPGTGHNVHVEEQRIFLEFVIKFLKTLCNGIRNVKIVVSLDIFQAKTYKASEITNQHGMEITLTQKLYTGLLHVAKTKYARRTAVDLVYKTHGQCGQQTPVIVLHGLLGSKRNWDSMSKKLASALNTCALVADARNHGESPHAGSHSYSDLASDVAQLMDKASIKRAAIIGHSMGGRTGMVLALTQPAKVERLVVVDISPITTAGILNNFFPKLIDAMKSVKFEGITNVGKARAAAKDAILASGVVDNMEGMDFILMNIAVKKDKTVGWLYNLDALQHSFKSIASFPDEMLSKTFDGPTLFVGGEKSNYIPPSDITGIKKIFPNAELQHIPNVGHNVHAEDPSSFFTMVSEFLKRK